MSPARKTLPVALLDFIGQHGTEWHNVMSKGCPMGAETFNIVLTCGADRETIDRCINRFALSLPVVSSMFQTAYWEVVQPNYVIELEVLSSSSGPRISMRAALCCSVEAVDQMLVYARLISSICGDSSWQIFGERRVTDVRGSGTLASWQDSFIQRREQLYKAHGLRDVQEAAVRSDTDCFKYIESFRKNS